MYPVNKLDGTPRMIADSLRFLSSIFKLGRPKGVDPLIYTLMALGGVTKRPSHYAGASAELERERLDKSLNGIDRFRKNAGKDVPVTTTDMRIPGRYGDINLKLYSVPSPEELVVYFHGGGWVIGSIATENHLCERISGAINAAVVSVDYSLAPEYIYPAGLEDALAAIEWAITMAPGLGIPPEEVVVAGSSAGANLAAAACFKRRDAGLTLPARQLLLYPVTDISTMETESYRRYGRKKLGLSAGQMEWFRSRYVPDDEAYTDPYISLNLADDFSSLPPAMVVTAEFDILRSEAESFCEKLAAAGTRVELIKAEGMVHAFLVFLDLVDSATEWFDLVIADYKRFRQA